MATHSSSLAWKIHGWRSLVGYSPRGYKESDMTEQLTLSLLLILTTTPQGRNSFLRIIIVL